MDKQPGVRPIGVGEVIRHICGNILRLCPSFATIVINSYHSDSSLFIDGETLLSQEGTTQGDPMAMEIYAIGILPLIHHLADESVKQSWFADDASVGGNLVGIHG